jgi:hypothetical protein
VTGTRPVFASIRLYGTLSKAANAVGGKIHLNRMSADAAELLRLAQFVERDEQDGGECSDEEEIHFVEQDQIADEAWLKNGRSGILGIVVDSDGFADWVGTDGILPALGCGKMGPLKGKARTMVISGADVILIPHVPEITFKAPAEGPRTSGQKSNAGKRDGAGGCGPVRTLFDLKVLRERDDR